MPARAYTTRPAPGRCVVLPVPAGPLSPSSRGGSDKATSQGGDPVSECAWGCPRRPDTTPPGQRGPKRRVWSTAACIKITLFFHAKQEHENVMKLSSWC